MLSKMTHTFPGFQSKLLDVQTDRSCDVSRDEEKAEQEGESILWLV